MNKLPTGDVQKRRRVSRKMASRLPKMSRPGRLPRGTTAILDVSKEAIDPTKSDSLSSATAGDSFALLLKARDLVLEVESECVRFHLAKDPDSLVGYLGSSDLKAEHRKFESLVMDRLEKQIGALPQDVLEFIQPLISLSAERINTETMKVLSSADVRFSRDDVLQFMGFDKKFGGQEKLTSVAERRRNSRLAKRYPLEPISAAVDEIDALYATWIKEGRKRVRFDWLSWVKRHYGEFVDAGLFDALEIKRLHPLPDGSSGYDRLVKQLDNMKSSLGEHFPDKSAARELRLRHRIAPGGQEGLVALEASSFRHFSARSILLLVI